MNAPSHLVGVLPGPDDVRKLEESWLTAKIVEQAGIRRVADSEARELVGRNRQAGEYQGLAFPYFVPGEDYVREYRIRRDHPDLEYKEGKARQRAKYIAPNPNQKGIEPV